MKAPDIETLFDIETAMLTATRAVLEEAGWTLHTSRGQEEMRTPYLTVAFDLGRVTEHCGVIPDSGGAMFFDTWEGTLSVTVCTNRRGSQPHGAAVGRLRWAMQRIGSLYTADVLPYHSIARLVESGTKNETTDREEDCTEIQFATVISIRPEAWPESSG